MYLLHSARLCILNKCFCALFHFFQNITIYGVQIFTYCVSAVLKILQIIPLCLKGIRKNIENPVKNIYIVAPDTEMIRQFCSENDLVYVDETSVLGFSPKELGLIINWKGHKVNRSGWLFQQFLKLSGKIGTCDNYICIDADHILINKHVFLTTNNVPVFYMSSENHGPYYRNIEKLIGMKRFSSLSYVAHKMIFNKNNLVELQKEIERENEGKTWIEAILYHYNRNELSGFSEFELYGNFVKNKKHRPWRELALKYTELSSFEELERKFCGKYNSLTFPEYLNIS